MDLAEQYARAVIPQRFTVLGQTLEPFTLGHALFLTRIDSPYAPWRTSHREADEATAITDLVTAIWVCAQPWRTAVKEITHRRTKRLFAKWARQIAGTKLSRAAALFQAYLGESIRGPRTFSKDTDTALRSPEVAIVCVMLAEAFGLSPEEALDSQLGAALWDLAAYHELKGRVELVDPVRAAALDSARRAADN